MNKENNTNQLDSVFKSFGKSLSEYDESIIQFILGNFDSGKYRWLVNQLCGLEDLTHRSITIEDLKRFSDFK